MDDNNRKNFNFKYIVLKQWIVDNIKNKTFKYNDKLPSENLLCRKFGISRQTVRNAMAQLSEEGVVKKVRGSGMYVNKTFAAATSKTVGILISYLNEYIFQHIFKEIETVLQLEGYEIDLCISENRIEQERGFLDRMYHSDVAGLIIEGTRSALPNPNIRYYRKLEEKDVPFLFIHNYYNDVKCPSILMDDIGASKRMTQMLIEAGHTEIAGIFKGDDLQGHRRYLGYVEALNEAGIPVREELIGWFYSNYDNNILLEISIKAILDTLDYYTAMVSYNDLIALEINKFCVKNGISIPDDVSMVSFDDGVASSSLGIISAKHPKKLLGIEAAMRILRMIREGREAIPPVPYVISTELALRDSIKNITAL
ncbi:MAG: GntR family transcriptional regulator [Christensenella sp.]|uniref:GntR family transcriptional regulator n=1 Tax=Christensenella sp. TaxID=1935934 RepID=UPI002B216C66|nr:GntR family transcriptional regulator [Christensenella sp.]MEA5004331.1 GntR family transcriptional regulator [Christensenella sp.]